MTITVIGATGNVGTLVARRLLAEGQRVRALVRDPDKARDRLGPDSRLEIITGDLGTPADLEAAFRVRRSDLAGAQQPATAAPAHPAPPQ